MDTGVTIESGMALESLFEHYAAQLTAAGWIPQGQAIGDGVSIGRWRVLDEDGNAVVGTLAIWALAEDELHRAWLRLDRASEAWPFDRP